jgi:hypothetical protein
MRQVSAGCSAIVEHRQIQVVGHSTQPRNCYQGCLASRLKLADCDHWLDNYNSKELDHIDLVPLALKQRGYDLGDVATRGILKETLIQTTGPAEGLSRIHQ